MKSAINTKVKKVRDALLTVSTSLVFHYEASSDSGDRYIVWAEDGQGSEQAADDRKQEQSITGSIDLYTKTEYDDFIDAIQDALNDAGISFYLNSVQYEDTTKFIHYEWVWEVA